KYYFDTKYIKCEVSALFSAGTPPDFVHRTYVCHITKMYNPPLNLGYLKKYAFQLPQMEYTRFPGAADEPPCPGEGYVDVARKGRFESAFIVYAVRGLADAFPPPGVSVYFLRWYCILLPLAIVVRVQKLTSTISLVRVREGR